MCFECTIFVCFVKMKFGEASIKVATQRVTVGECMSGEFHWGGEFRSSRKVIGFLGKPDSLFQSVCVF